MRGVRHQPAWRRRAGRRPTGPGLALLAAAILAIGASGCTGGSGPAPSGRSSAATSGSGPSFPTKPVAHPNVVFVLTDDLSTNLVQYMPHLLALRRAGTSFSNYTVTDSLCCPSRSSIFSGKFPHDTGVFTNTGADGGFDVFHSRGEENDTFATALQQAGYRTAMMGKYLNGYNPADTLGGSQPYVPPGWNEWDVAGNGYHEFNYDLNQNHRVVHYGTTASDYLTDVVSGKGSAFISASAASHAPFLLEIATFAPHAPYIPAPRDANAFPSLTAPRGPAFDTLPSDPPTWLAARTPLTSTEIGKIDTAFRKRVQAVQAVDRMIAALEATLAKAGVAGSTDIVFSSDNGYHMGQRRLMPGKQTAFDHDIRVPLVVVGPGVRPGREIDALAQNTDLRPTFSRIGGAHVPSNVDGRSLLDLLHGRRVPHDWRDAALIEHHGPDLLPSDPDHPGKGSGNPTTYEAIRTPHSLYVEYRNGEREYYDLRKDPYELVNTVGRLSERDLAHLHARLVALERCKGMRSCRAAGK
ncbi:MAG: sulfatase family protein [Mycobacteriales bacterium]